MTSEFFKEFRNIGPFVTSEPASLIVFSVHSGRGCWQRQVGEPSCAFEFWQFTNSHPILQLFFGLAGFIQDMSTDVNRYVIFIHIHDQNHVECLKVTRLIPASFVEGKASAIGTCYIGCEHTHTLQLELKPFDASRYSHSGRDIGCFPNMSLAKATWEIEGDWWCGLKMGSEGFRWFSSYMDRHHL